jgi:hypothetical protein
MVGKKIIYGCEARGDGDKPYLTRYTLISLPGFILCLHIFHRSDADDLHDHPWNFTSFILWRGYVEETEGGKKRRVWPGMILRRLSTHKHRVELVNGKKAITLVVMGKYRKSWGFWVKDIYMAWRDYFQQKGC